MDSEEFREGEPDPPEALLQAIRNRAGDAEELALAFAKVAWRRADEPARARLRDDADAMAARLAGLAELSQDRKPGELALRVIDPTTEADGWDAPGSVVEIALDGAPFQTSTVLEELDRQGLHPLATLHPVIGVERDTDGRITGVMPARNAPQRESVICVDLAEHLDPQRRTRLAADLARVLGDARAATRDFPAMRDKVIETVAGTQQWGPARYGPEEVADTVAFLNWLLADHFVLLGYREYELIGEGADRAVRVVEGSGLGILHDESASTYSEPVRLKDIEPSLAERMVGGELLTVARTNRTSTVHRSTRMVYVGVKVVNDAGELVGERRVLGLFAYKAYVAPASGVPVLGRKLAEILEAEDVVDHSRDERSLRALFEAIPKLELLSTPTAELRRQLTALLDAQRRGGVLVLRRVDERGRGTAVTVSLPRERFNATVRERIQKLLADRFTASGVDYHLSMVESDQALLSFVLHHAPGVAESVELPELQAEVTALTRTWDDALADALSERWGTARGEALAARWAGRLTSAYTDRTRPEDAVDDLATVVAACADPTGMRVRLQAPRGEDDLWRVKLMRRGHALELSALVPVLESLGLVVVEEVPHPLEVPAPDAASQPASIQDFGVRAAAPTADLVAHGEQVAEAILAAAHGVGGVDSLNQLTTTAGVDWRDVAVLRAYRRYRRQLGTAFTEAYQNEALVAHPEVAIALLDLFSATHDPKRASSDATGSARTRLRQGLDAIQRLDQDRILRGYAGLVEATVRTNRYVERGESSGARALALKLDSARVPDAPRPVPHVEVFVSDPLVEGIHLRGGEIARGGLRWSDRLEDFRTEVLGLMKAQMLKNAIIVPSGAKGGFVLTHPPQDRDELRAAVEEQYRVYIRALLDITDNVVDGEVVAPPGVVPTDGDDPYLVVAADRGTATFSDTANAISEEYGFWLADAFASGGSSGYDHKAMGITARGAWVAVRRHFRELGIDVQTEPVDVVGIGDMSGDVFGNGLLQSSAVRLVAAFDHRDIFIDPNPDPERSYTERRRLFELPRSSWQDYDREILSEGGGVWSRSIKEIELSPEAVEALSLPSDRMTPPDLIRALLHAPSDLLFAGGIGTFVRAQDETDDEVGDRANDAIRVTGDKLGARVVGEGGNLALTQRARIAYARRGGRCNTDAVDNAAGVATSDLEVNLKILLRDAIDAGLCDSTERDAILLSMTDDVAASVLRDVDHQTWAISSELRNSTRHLDSYELLMMDLEEAGRLDREIEVLPDARELDRRRGGGAGLTRPELAVLIAGSKVDLRTRLLRSDLPDAAEVQHFLVDYFPPAARERFADVLGRHRLRRELVATSVANDLVDRMGPTWVSRTANEFGAMAWEVTAAYLAAREVSDAAPRWRATAVLDERTDPALQLELKAEVDQLVDALARAYLRTGVTLSTAVARDREPFAALEACIDDAVGADLRAERRARADRFIDLGVDEALASELTGLRELALAPDVAAAVRETGRQVPEVAAVFFGVGEALPFEALRQRLTGDVHGQWARWQQRGLLDELRSLRTRAARWALDASDAEDPEEAIAAFIAARREGVERTETLVRQLDRDDSAGLDGVAVAVRALRDAVRA